MLRLAAGAVFLLACAASAWAAAPTDALRQVFAQADQILTDPETEDRPMERLVAIRRLINDALDFRETAALALGRRWATATPAEQAEFTQLLADMLERSYIARLASQASLDNGARIEYLSEFVNGGDALVATTVARRNGGKIYLDYRMIDRDGRWRVRDVTVDGVSVAANYRSQIERVLQQGSLADLLAQMRDNVNRVEPSLRAVLAGEVEPTETDWVVEIVPRKKPATTAVVPTAPPTESEPVTVAVVEKVVPTESVSDAVVETITPTGSEWTVAMAPADPAESVAVAETTPTAEPVAPVEAPTSVAAVETAAPADTAAVAATPAVDTTVPKPPAAETRVAALAWPPAPVEAPRVVVAAAPPQPATPVTKAYWLRLGTVEAIEASGRLSSLLDERKLVVAVESTLTPPALSVRLGPFTDATEAVMKLLELQGKGHDPSLVAERE